MSPPVLANPVSFYRSNVHNDVVSFLIALIERIHPREPTMSLSPEQRREYRGIAHNLKPVIIVGDRGLTEGLREELERALNDHELIKIKVANPDRESRQEAVAALCEASGAELIQTIGKIAVIMRRAKQPNPKLSNLMRHK